MSWGHDLEKSIFDAWITISINVNLYIAPHLFHILITVLVAYVYNAVVLDLLRDVLIGGFPRSILCGLWNNSEVIPNAFSKTEYRSRVLHSLNVVLLERVN